MARPLRIEYPGAVYHITSRGNARGEIFKTDTDRDTFFEILNDVVIRYNWLCHSYCLMDNHYHLLIETPDGNLSIGMRQLNGVYTQAYNRSHGRDGHLFKGRYKSILVEKDNYLLELCRYVVLNPVRAKMVKNPESYIWSSYLATMGKVKIPDFLTIDWILVNFSQQISSARSLYQKFVQDDMGNGINPWKKISGSVFLGSMDFVIQIQEQYGPDKQITEIPRSQRYVGRPELEVIFPSGKIISNDERNRLIYLAHVTYGYNLISIAQVVGIHYTTVSKIVNCNKD